MKNSQIEWTDHTFNPWIGCTKVSQGCKNCYAETYGHRFGVEWGPQGERKRTSATYWRQPLAWNRQHWMQCLDCGIRFQSNTSSISLSMCDGCGSRNIEPARARVFCASLADVFEDRPELIPWRADLIDLITETPNLDWLILTKRPENIRRLWSRTLGVTRQNIWFGTSVENQEQANKRIPQLLSVQTAVRFLSIEPLLGPIDLSPLKTLQNGTGPKIDWVIVGGESGPHARPMHPDWPRSLRDQCASANVPFFFKQWGEHLPRGQWNVHGMESLMYAAGCEAFGGTAPPRSIQWDEEMWAYKVGKHDAGRLLDGAQWDQYPVRQA